MFGVLDTTAVDFPPNVDQTYLNALRTRAGLRFPDVLREIDARLVAFNRTQDPLVAELVTPTTEASARRRNVVGFEVTERAEHTMARPQRTKGAGHMLPVRGYDVAVGFTEDGLQAMSLADILDNVDSMLLGFRLNHRRQVLVRLFNPAEVPVDDTTNVTSPGFAGSGTGANAFTGSYPTGEPLGPDFTLYAAFDTAGGYQAAVTAMDMQVEKLRKLHGSGVILDLLPSEGLLALLRMSAKFTTAESPLIRVGVGADRAAVDPTRYVGAYGENVRVRHAVQEISTVHGVLFRAAAGGGAGNILAWRYIPDAEKPNGGRGAYIRYRDFFPLSQATMLQDFGVGVNDRTGAALIYGGAGANAYVVPSFSY